MKIFKRKKKIINKELMNLNSKFCSIYRRNSIYIKLIEKIYDRDIIRELDNELDNEFYNILENE